MLKTGIINPGINSLLSRVRHTDTLIILDWSFLHMAGVETIDLSLMDGIQRVISGSCGGILPVLGKAITRHVGNLITGAILYLRYFQF